MKRRGKRLAVTAAAIGLALLLGLGILYRDSMRDHIEAWRFQLTRETRTIEPDDVIPPEHPIEEHVLHHVAKSLRRPVIFSPEDIQPPVRWPTQSRVGGLLEMNGWRSLEQRLPRRAYIVVADPAYGSGWPAQNLSGSTTIEQLGQLRDEPRRAPR